MIYENLAAAGDTVSEKIIAIRYVTLQGHKFLPSDSIQHENHSSPQYLTVIGNCLSVFELNIVPRSESDLFMIMPCYLKSCRHPGVYQPSVGQLTRNRKWGLLDGPWLLAGEQAGYELKVCIIFRSSVLYAINGPRKVGFTWQIKNR